MANIVVIPEDTDLDADTLKACSFPANSTRFHLFESVKHAGISEAGLPTADVIVCDLYWLPAVVHWQINGMRQKHAPTVVVASEIMTDHGIHIIAKGGSPNLVARIDVWESSCPAVWEHLHAVTSEVEKRKASVTPQSFREAFGSVEAPKPPFKDKHGGAWPYGYLKGLCLVAAPR